MPFRTITPGRSNQTVPNTGTLTLPVRHHVLGLRVRCVRNFNAFGTLDHMPHSESLSRRPTSHPALQTACGRQIGSGQLQPGEQLPGRRELAGHDFVGQRGVGAGSNQHAGEARGSSYEGGPRHVRGGRLRSRADDLVGEPAGPRQGRGADRRSRGTRGSDRSDGSPSAPPPSRSRSSAR